MTAQALLSTAEELLAGDRGTLAMAESTVTCHRRSVTAARAQETGGRVGELAAACLNAVNLPSRAGVLWAHGFWAHGFWLGRAIRQPALESWDGGGAYVVAAQPALRDRARCEQMARRGARSTAGERTAA